MVILGETALKIQIIIYNCYNSVLSFITKILYTEIFRN